MPEHNYRMGDRVSVFGAWAKVLSSNLTSLRIRYDDDTEKVVHPSDVIYCEKAKPKS